MSRYEIRSTATAEVISHHRSRQGALDAWRGTRDVEVVIVRTYADGREVPVVTGRWLA